MKNKWLFIAGLSGLLCVAIGAFAAHGLSKVLEPKELAWIETGVRYQMFHTIAILAIGILQLCRESLVTNKMANFAAGSWAYGILLFSGSLYALALGVGKFLFFNDTATTEIYTPDYTLSLHDALAGVSGQVVAETDDDAVGFYRALDFDIGPAPSDPRWPGRRRYRCVRRS